MSEIVDQSDATLLNSFQRDLNRATDSDRSTRKRGLQKLLEDVPWSKKSQREKLKVFVSNSLLRVLFSTIADEVEKCRELTMQILKRCLEKCNDISAKHMHELVVILCARIGEVPFAEPAEEIRLLIVEVLLMIKKHTAFINVHTSISVDAMVTSTGAEQSLTEIDEKILQTLTKTLTDGFPSVKRSGAELMLSVGLTSPSTVKSYFKQLLKPLSTNSTHQHSKTRTITLQAIGRGLQCLGLEEYHTLLKDPILAILLRTVSDRTASVRIELGNVCVNIFTHRVEECLARECALLAEDFELIVVLLLLHGDVIEEVAQEGKRQLIRAVRHWKPLLLKVESLEVDVPIHHSGMDIEDGEKALATAHTSTEADLKPPSDCNASAVAIDYDNITQLTAFMSSNLHNLLDILHEGVESWTTDSRKRYLRAMNRFISYTDASLNTVLPRILSLLAPAVRDEDAEVRVAAEECCVRLGAQAVPEQLLEILLPRMAGAVAGGDTASQRANAISVLTCILKGVRQQSVSDSVNTLYLCTTVATGLTESSLYTYREASLRESVLLLVRVFVEHFSEQCQASAHIQEALLLALLFLCGKCPGEDDVISEVAHKELRRMALTCTGSEDPGPLLGAHYAFLFYHVTTAELSSSALLGGKVDISDTRNAEVLTQFYTAVELRWESDSHAMATFAVLLREAPYPSWAHHAWVLPVVRRMVQPVQAPATGSAEANMLSYAAQRGEDVPNVNIGLVDARLHLLALLEGMVRAGTANWECSQHIATASATIIRFIIVPNLVWRVGRVEATVRKVALALAYGILKAGAVPSETLFSTAAELVPLIVSHLDDSEVTPRQMACLCVTVLFERLRGVFSEQSIHEIYPKLVARLDDSNDQVRIAICGALVMFFQCGSHPRCFSSTTIDYTLDQLFIHLDDPDPSIQQAVLAAIVQLAKTLDKEAVLKKADKNRSCHRTPVMCDKVVFEVTGVEILED